jgi:Family of unknown function (DUF6049)
MRRPVAFAVALLAVLASLATPAVAQEPVATLTLLGQTPWATPDEPAVELRVLAKNVGDIGIDELSLGVTLWSPVTSGRAQYEASLLDDPASGVPLLTDSRRREGSLASGEVREFTVPLDLPLDLLDTESRVYPLTIDLRSGFNSLASVRTSVIFIVENPGTPLNVSWTFVLSTPLMTGPDGAFWSSTLERSISPGGRLAGMISALRTIVVAGVPVDVVVSPLLLMQLDEMRDGYSVSQLGQVRVVEVGGGATDEAAAALDALRFVASAPNVELSALPFSAPWLPALAAGDLAGDVAVQLEHGRDVVDRLLEATPDPKILRPPDSVLDEQSLDAVAAEGVGLLLLDDTTVPAPEQDLAPPPTTELNGRDATVTALVGDPSIQDLVTSESIAVGEDPVRAAQAVLGELATIWLEAPETERSIAVIFGESTASVPGAFFPPLAHAVARRPPWLAARTATTIAGSFPPLEPADSLVATPGAFSHPYAAALKQARRGIRTLRTMLVPTDPLDRLETLLLLAESGRFVGNETEGGVFIDRVHDTVDEVFGRVRAPDDQIFTLTGSAASVPVRITNDNPFPVRVRVRLSSTVLRTDVERRVELNAETTQTLDFDVELLTTGRHPVDIQILSPSQRLIGVYQLGVRSTGYNRVALWITLGAAALALLVWARRFLPRRAP